MKELTTVFMIKVLVLLTLFCLGNSMGYAQDFVWANSIGGAGTDQSNVIAVDAQGGVYIAGQYSGIVDFDPGPGTVNLIGNGFFLAKYNYNGEYIWAKSFIGTTVNQRIGIATDAACNIYITGSFEGTVDFDPNAGIDTLVSNGYSDIFLAKYDQNGNYIWSKNIGGQDIDRSNGIALDGSGNLYITGQFRNTVDFDPGIGTASLSAPSSFDADIFLAKYDAGGNYLWARNMGGNGSDLGEALAVSSSGYIYLTGNFMDTADFDPGANTSNLIASGLLDVFVAKYDSNGDYIWAKSIKGTGPNDANGSSLALGEMDNIFLTGRFKGTADFDPGVGVANVTSNGGYDIYLARFDSSGNYLWAKSFGSTGTVERGSSLAIDNSGGLYLTGSFQSTVDFDPGPGTANLTATPGFVDAFFVQFDDMNNFVFAKQFSRSNSESLTLDALGNIYLTGRFSGTPDFDPGVNTFNLTSNGATDIFMLKLGYGCAVAVTFTQTACDSFTFNNTTYTNTGNYADTFLTASNCDSIVILSLTINHSTQNPVVSGVFCDSATFNGITYTSSGTYVQQYINASGCDSNFIYDITIGQSAQSQISHTACGSYVFNGSNYTTSGMYTDTFSNSTGCDSIVMLDLTINHVNTAVIKNGSTLTAHTSDTYQWINCDPKGIIPGATGQSFTASENGAYAVIVSKDGCTDTSDCIQVDNITSIEGLKAFPQHIIIYPSPANKSGVTIQSSAHLSNVTIKISDLAGRVLTEHHNKSGTSFFVNLEAYTPGLYLIEIVDDTKAQRKTMKLLVQEY